MKRLLSLLIAYLFVFSLLASRHDYSFSSKPLSQALTEIASDFRGTRINFIYNQLEDYRVTSDFSASDAATAVRKLVHSLPVTISVKGKTIFVEARQKGNFRFTGRTVDENSEPVPFAMVLLLNPSDSTVVTYATTADDGSFVAPCDRGDVLVKVRSVGYSPVWKMASSEVVGDIVMKPLPVNLKNVDVKADRQYLEADKAVFVPSRREKNSSTDAVSLLMRMALPTVTVNPIDNSISGIGGEGVATFIDFQPADRKELAALRPQDVKRVEVYEFPADPRFEGARHVVNFIMVKYEYGGYSKATAFQRVVSLYGDYSVASKFVYRQMTYDVSAGYDFTDSRHYSTRQETRYAFPDQDVVRIVEPDATDYNSHREFMSFRARYQTDSLTISNTVGFTGSQIPVNWVESHTTYSPAIYPAGNTRTQQTSRNNAVSWSGHYQFTLPRTWMLTISPKANLAHNNNDYAWFSEEDDIANIARENLWRANISAMAQKNWGRHSLSVTLVGELDGDHLVYSGSNPATVDYSSQAVGVHVNCNTSFWKMWIQGGGKCYISRLGFSGQRSNVWLPGYYISAGLNIDRKNTITLSSEMSNWTNSVSQLSPNVVVKNLLDAVKGNPDLKTFLFNSVSLRYQWMPVQKFSMAVFSRFERFTKPFDYSYTPVEIDGRTMMLASYVEDGFYNDLSYGLSASLRLFDNSLMLSGSFNGRTVARRGLNNFDRTCLNFNISAWYYLKDFYFGAHYYNDYRSVSLFQYGRNPCFYSISAGWSHGPLNIMLQANSPFSSDWKSRFTNSSYPGYTNITTEYGGNYHRSFAIQISYNISYGRKVAQENLEGVYAPSSGIVR